jgi:hypothetical protein
MQKYKATNVAEGSAEGHMVIDSHVTPNVTPARAISSTINSEMEGEAHGTKHKYSDKDVSSLLVEQHEVNKRLLHVLDRLEGDAKLRDTRSDSWGWGSGSGSGAGGDRGSGRKPPDKSDSGGSLFSHLWKGFLGKIGLGAAGAALGAGLSLYSIKKWSETEGEYAKWAKENPYPKDTPISLTKDPTNAPPIIPESVKENTGNAISNVKHTFFGDQELKNPLDVPISATSDPTNAPSVPSVTSDPTNAPSMIPAGVGEAISTVKESAGKVVSNTKEAAKSVVQKGIGIAKQWHAKWTPKIEGIVAAAAASAGLSANFLKELVYIESRGNPDAVMGSSIGLGQVQQRTVDSERKLILIG